MGHSPEIKFRQAEAIPEAK